MIIIRHRLSYKDEIRHKVRNKSGSKGLRVAIGFWIFFEMGPGIPGDFVCRIAVMIRSIELGSRTESSSGHRGCRGRWLLSGENILEQSTLLM